MFLKGSPSTGASASVAATMPVVKQVRSNAKKITTENENAAAATGTTKRRQKEESVEVESGAKKKQRLSRSLE